MNAVLSSVLAVPFDLSVEIGKPVHAYAVWLMAKAKQIIAG